MELFSGEVIFFNPEKGFGFATKDTTGSIFFHFSALRFGEGEDVTLLVQGTPIFYKLGENDKGVCAYPCWLHEPMEGEESGPLPGETLHPKPPEQIVEVTEPQRVCGKVTYWNSDRGFGFAGFANPVTGEEVSAFVHLSQITGRGFLNEGEEIIFTPEYDSRKDRWQGVKVEFPKQEETRPSTYSGKVFLVLGENVFVKPEGDYRGTLPVGKKALFGDLAVSGTLVEGELEEDGTIKTVRPAGKDS